MNIPINYDSISEIKQLMTTLGFSPRKKWGQNFLINPHARQRIVSSLEAKKGDKIWEVGPGLGAITHMLLQKEVDLTCFEIDPGYIALLNKWYGELPNFKVIHGDVIKTWKDYRPDKNTGIKVAGNLPYNAASSIIGAFINHDFIPDIMVITVQKEMAQRMVAKAGNKNYSTFSILCQSTFDVTITGDLNPGSFYPPPGVTSSIAKMVPHGRLKEIENRKLFFSIVREIFVSRRKTIRNNLKNTTINKLYGMDRLLPLFEETQIKLTDRPENVTIQQYIDLANKINKLEQQNG